MKKIKISIKKVVLSICLVALSIAIYGQEIPVFTKYEDFEKEVLTIKDDKTYVVNLWATWCGPCVAELPYFEEFNKKYSSGDTEVVLVSIDWATNLERKVKPFIEKKGLESTVMLFDDPKANDWIDKIDPSWSGAIPITLFIDKNRKQFYEKEYHSLKELEEDFQAFKKK